MVFRVDIVLSPAINDPGLRDQNLISSPANGLCHSLIWRTERDIIGGDRQAHPRLRDGRYAANDFACALVAIFEV